MYRTNTCGELRLQDAGKQVTLAGWVQRTRKMGGMTFVDVRDRYGITQIVFDESKNADLCARANKLGREFCVQVKGEVSERESKNAKMPTGDIEILATELNVLSESLTPPFTIEDKSDGGDDLRMKYRYLDLRRNPVRKNMELRHRMTILIRNFLDSKGLHRSGDSYSYRQYARRSSRLRGAFTYESWPVLCFAAESADAEAALDGEWFRPLFPDCQVFPR